MCRGHPPAPHVGTTLPLEQAAPGPRFPRRPSRRLSGSRYPRALRGFARLFPQPSRPGEGAAAASGHTCGGGSAGRRRGGSTMTVGARLGDKARSRFSRRGTGDDQVSILPGGEEEAAGSGAAAPEEDEEEEEEEEGAGRRKVRFALLPDSYEPLRPPRAPGKRHYGKRLKKYGKNVSKALQKGCRYLVVGLQGLASAYSAPFGVAAQVASFVR
ncbi:required for drug-induced death protein 1 [Lathamus discolor]|uniref:required for drug-induced death protein 1 n=1 Tax=Lathamus discolor TaxID=678569 RepID=UPI0032B752A0